MICSFLTIDNIHKHISNRGYNLTPYSIAVGHENVYFSTPHFKIPKREKVNYFKLLEKNKKSIDPFDYHVSNCGRHLFKKTRIYEVHSN